MKRVLEISTSPHVVSDHSVDKIMLNVVLSLLPVTAFAIYAFGLTALLTLAVATAGCVLVEHALCRLNGQPTSIGDWSAVITGLLFGLTLPPALPLWMVLLGAVIAIGLGKHLFGGLGHNCFNPALVARAVLQATFPVPMTTWTTGFGADRFHSIAKSSLAAPFSRPAVDIVTSATPLSAFKFEQQLTSARELAFGMTSGSTGETCAVLILIGGGWLVARRMMNFRITLSILATVAVATWGLELAGHEGTPPVSFMLLSGGLMLGAVFMATDMVGSPMTHTGCILYGALIGVIVVAIRVFGGMPEGVMYAVLLGNAASPHIDRLIQPRVFGTHRTLKQAPEVSK